MKEKYIIPTIEMFYFTCQDIVTSSNETDYVPFGVDPLSEIEDTNLQF